MKDMSLLTKVGVVFLVIISLGLVTVLIFRARRVDRLFPPQELKVVVNEQNR